jgi:thioredoxin 1
MKRFASLFTVLGFVVATGVVFGGDAQTPATPSNTNAPVEIKLPRLLDLGADKCIPCKKMAPILSGLKSNYVGQLEVEFIDVWKNPDAAKPYKVRLIPTQIFFDAQGKELFRHEGFYGKADILAKWKELGVNLKSSK